MSDPADEVRQNAEIATGQKRLVWLVISPDYLVALCQAGEPARIARPEIDATGLIRIPVLAAGVPEEVTEITGATVVKQIPIGVQPFQRPKRVITNGSRE